MDEEIILSMILTIKTGYVELKDKRGNLIREIGTDNTVAAPGAVIKSAH
jgi:hypothetical protein